MKLEIERIRRPIPSAIVAWGLSLGIFGCSLSVFHHFEKPPSMTAPVAHAFEDEGCRRIYTQFYAQPKVDLRVVFGYKDARPARFVADRYERMIFVQRLVQPCRKKDEACGFTRSTDDADLFSRQISGPDGLPRMLQLRVAQSSAGPDDEENRQDPFQKWKSKQATLTFLDGITKADAVFYNGHSRAGGGPDFEPPVLAFHQGVNFDSYKYHEPGFSQVIAALEGAPSKMQLFGLYSCASTKHFLGRVQAIKPELGLVTSPNLIYFSDALESSLETLSALIAMKCEGSFRKGLKSRGAREGGARVSGFFE